jgi:hypothetical protein
MLVLNASTIVNDIVSRELGLFGLLRFISDNSWWASSLNSGISCGVHFDNLCHSRVGDILNSCFAGLDLKLLDQRLQVVNFCLLLSDVIFCLVL